MAWLVLDAALLTAAPVLAAEPTLTLDLGAGASLELVLVEAGRYRQGSAPGEAGRAADEAPREVTLTTAFYVGLHEVTVAQWTRFVAATGYRSEAEKGTSGGFGWDGKALVQAPRFNWRTPGFPSGDRHPVTIVTYDDAVAFTTWLTRRSGRSVTLPTEAQWEYAARAGSTTAFPPGDRDVVAAEIGWFKANAPDGPREVGQKKANALGLYDTAGNVYEWCLDWYGPYEAGAVTDPLQTRPNLSDKPRRVLRGGSWLKDARALRSAARYRNAPGSRNADNGFRIVAAVEAKPTPAPARSGEPSGTGADEATEGSTGSALAGLAILLGLGGLCVGAPALAVFLLLRRRRGVRTRIAEDGFTLLVKDARVGQRLHYRYRAGGVSKTGQITITGDPADGVFVYTGERPSAIELLSAAAASTSPPPPAPLPRRAAASSIRPVRSEPDEPFRGYPPAY